MPSSTWRTIVLPLSAVQRCKTLSKCESRSGTISTSVGRVWNGNQRRRRSGFMPPSPCNSTQRSSNTSIVKQGVCPCGTTYAFNGTGSPGPGSGPFGEQSSNGAHERRLQSIALSRFLNNNGLGVTLAETSGTLRSLSDRLGAVVKILNSLRKGNVRGALSTLHQHTGYNTTRAEARLKADPGRNFSDRASNFWLETTFGWVPLLQSIHDSLETLGKEYRTDRRSRASDSANGLRAGIAAEFRSSVGNRFSKLGLTNPAEIAWDLVPFSFVLDWFVPVADSLRFLGTRSLVTAIYMWSSREWGQTYNLSNYLGAPSGTLKYEMTYYARSISIPTVSTFTTRLPATMWHAVTSAALIQSLRPR